MFPNPLSYCCVYQMTVLFVWFPQLSGATRLSCRGCWDDGWRRKRRPGLSWTFSIRHPIVGGTLYVAKPAQPVEKGVQWGFDASTSFALRNNRLADR